MGGARPSHGTSATVYDLRNGQLLTLADVLRPGTDTLLQRLITQHLLDGSTPDIMPRRDLPMPTHADELAPLPMNGGFSLTDYAMEFGYYLDEVHSFVESGGLLFSVSVPYQEVLPLLRSSSPVARMLRERGLWKLQKRR